MYQQEGDSGRVSSVALFRASSFQWLQHTSHYYVQKTIERLVRKSDRQRGRSHGGSLVVEDIIHSYLRYTPQLLPNSGVENRGSK